MPAAIRRDADAMRIEEWLFSPPFAHRGLHGPVTGHVENSPGAFAAAVKAGVGIELDVQASADHQAIVFHDEDLERLTGEKGALSTLTADELGQQRLRDSGESIPTLPQILNMVAGGVPLLIEIKSRPGQTGPLERAVADALDSYDGPTAVMSFNPSSLVWFAEMRPHVTRGLVVSTRYRSKLGWRLSTTMGHARAFRASGADFVAYDIRSLPTVFSRACRTEGVPVLSWTVRSAEDRARARLYADNIIFELA